MWLGTARSESLSVFGLFEFCEDVRVALAGCEQIFKLTSLRDPALKSAALARAYIAGISANDLPSVELPGNGVEACMAGRLASRPFCLRTAIVQF
jgi:hypothetical protein